MRALLRYRHIDYRLIGNGSRVAEGSYLQAYNKASGELLQSVEVDRSLHGSPMTYQHEGRQYIVLAGGGQREPSELLAFALPR